MVFTPLAPEAHLVGVTVSMRVVSAGKGYGYLLRSVVQGDGDATQATAFTRYFTAAGTPPGVWLGKGVAYFGVGELRPGMVVTPDHLQTLLAWGNDPVTGENLGQPFREYPTVTERTAALTARVDRALPAEEFDAEVARIQAEQAARGPQTATAGFDLTFSVPKSVSVLWGVADANAQELIVAAHHAAVAQVLDLFEREVAATRTGHAGIAQVPVVGIAAAAYDHWDSRANDPQLHTHVVVSNKVMTAHDGQWRTLDSRAVHHAIVALSEHYNAVLADRLTGTFGLSWERRERGADRSAQWEVQGVSEELVAEFSSRARAIDLATDAKIADYVGEHGHYPSDRRIVGMRAEATLDTRPEKNIRALADLTAEWRARAQEIVRGDPTEWARKLTTTPPAQVVPQDSVPMYLIDQAAADVVDAVSEKRSTWRHWNLWAEASRRTMGWRFETVEDRELVVALITEAATRQSVPLTPGEVTTTLAALRRDGGTSALRPRHSTYYTSEHLLAAEDRLLALSQDRVTALVVPQHIVETVPGARVGGVVVDGEQAAALARVLASGRRLDLLVGPAGTGKSTAMAALLDAWTTQHGPGSVVGMAPSAAAAQVLADDLGIGCDNTAKWVHDHRRGKADFRPGQLVILDEATLASTRTLEDIATRAAEVGAKVVLVGDPAQLQSVDAGGAFSMLVEARDGDIARLVEVRRFVHAWEKAASLALRDGDVAAIDAYESHGRILEGTTEAMIDAAYDAWQEDLRVGHSSILVTEAAESVRHLNERARAERIQSGLTSTQRDVPLRDDARASAGDVIITRRNDRRLRPSPDTWVRNGDRWTVTHVGSDGTLDVRRVGDPSGASLTLPAGYVARHVDLGYAITGHRAQGVTVDTAHTVVTATTTRENFYVAMTRGRHGNYAYVATDTTDDAHIAPHPSDNPDAAARSVLYGVLQHVGAELSAHETVTAEQERWGSIAQLVAEYETIAQAGQHDRWATLLETSGLTEGQVDLVLGSDAYGALSAELRRAEANHHDLDELFPRLVAARDFADADDIASVLHHRLARATARPAGSGRTRRSPWLIAGLIPYASGVTDPEMHHALTEREELIEHRASAVLDRDLNEGEPWTAALGTKPADARTAQRWRQAGRVAAAYRDRYQITDDTPLGPGPRSDAQKLDAARATAALTRAQQLSRHTPNTEQPDLTMEARQGRAL